MSISDWSSDVCSSDLPKGRRLEDRRGAEIQEPRRLQPRERGQPDRTAAQAARGAPAAGRPAQQDGGQRQVRGTAQRRAAQHRQDHQVEPGDAGIRKGRVNAPRRRDASSHLPAPYRQNVVKGKRRAIMVKCGGCTSNTKKNKKTE